ncbi:MAG: hypothetical protein KDE15_02295 [Erythrobacter sp.]|nr:hypothetical protein [Erythrobacter sp.]
MKVGYASAMGENTPHIVLRLNTKEPIELSDFVRAFTSLGNEYERFLREQRPDMADHSTMYVKQVREGSIEAELWNYAPVLAAAAITHMDQLLILEQFVKQYGKRLRSFFVEGGRLPDAGKRELNDFMGQVAAIANDPNGTAEIKAATYEDKQRQVKAAVRFDTKQARIATRQIEAQKREMESKNDADHKRVLMRFVRPSIEKVTSHKRTGERALIEAVHEKPLAVFYASDLARDRIQHEMKVGEANIFHLLFDVDVNVEFSNGKPVAYRIMAVHDITDSPESDAE